VSTAGCSGNTTDVCRRVDFCGFQTTISVSRVSAIAEGFHYLDAPDEERLAHGFAVYDALYAWCQHQLKSES
jgi:hypothetical protein